MDPGPTISVLANDNDLDGDLLKVPEVTDPKNGEVAFSPDKEGVMYKPNPGYTDEDSFKYTTCNPFGECDTATVNVVVDAMNDDLIVFDDRDSTPEDEPVVVDLLENNLPDVALEVTEVTDPENGKCVVAEDGSSLATMSVFVSVRYLMIYVSCMRLVLSYCFCVLHISCAVQHFFSTLIIASKIRHAYKEPQIVTKVQ